MRVHLRKVEGVSARVPLSELIGFAEWACGAVGNEVTVRGTLSDTVSFEDPVDSLAGLQSVGPYRSPRAPFALLSCALHVEGDAGRVDIDVGAVSGWRRITSRVVVRHVDGLAADSIASRSRSLLRASNSGLIALALGSFGAFVAGWIGLVILVAPILGDAQMHVRAEAAPDFNPALFLVLFLGWVGVTVALVGRGVSTITVTSEKEIDSPPAWWTPSAESVRRWTVIGGVAGVVGLLVASAALAAQLIDV